MCSSLSDFHKSVLTVLKTSFDKNKPCEVLYRDYKSFNEDLQNNLSTTQINTCKPFEDTFLSVLKMHTPLKKKLLRANHSLYVTKALRKTIMRKSNLGKIYFKEQTNESLKAYKNHKSYCSNLYKKERKKFFDNLNTPAVSDNKTFWKVIKSFLTNKGSFGGNIKLILKDETEIAEELNLFFSNAVKSLNISKNTYIINRVSDDLIDPVVRAK